MPKRDQSAERGECRKISRKRRENVLVLRNNGHMVAVIAASPKAVMMASMLGLEVLVDGGR